jgi:hypothetical protein
LFADGPISRCLGRQASETIEDAEPFDGDRVAGAL